jgi:hypothetical protein
LPKQQTSTGGLKEREREQRCLRRALVSTHEKTHQTFQENHGSFFTMDQGRSFTCVICGVAKGESEFSKSQVRARKFKCVSCLSLRKGKLDIEEAQQVPSSLLLLGDVNKCGNVESFRLFLSSLRAQFTVRYATLSVASIAHVVKRAETMEEELVKTFPVVLVCDALSDEDEDMRETLEILARYTSAGGVCVFFGPLFAHVGGFEWCFFFRTFGARHLRPGNSLRAVFRPSPLAFSLDARVAPFSMRSECVRGALPKEMLLRRGQDSGNHLLVWSHARLRQTETGAVMCNFGKGKWMYFGDVNLEAQSLALVSGICSKYGTAALRSSKRLCVVCREPAYAHCSGCGLAEYCGINCQKEDWLNHKLICHARQASKQRDIDNDPAFFDKEDKENDPMQFGFTRGQLDELLYQGVNPWDQDACEVLNALMGYDYDEEMEVEAKGKML